MAVTKLPHASPRRVAPDFARQLDNSRFGFYLRSSAHTRHLRNCHYGVPDGVNPQMTQMHADGPRAFEEVTAKKSKRKKEGLDDAVSEKQFFLFMCWNSWKLDSRMAQRSESSK